VTSFWQALKRGGASGAQQQFIGFWDAKAATRRVELLQQPLQLFLRLSGLWLSGPWLDCFWLDRLWLDRL